LVRFRIGRRLATVWRAAIGIGLVVVGMSFFLHMAHRWRMSPRPPR